MAYINRYGEYTGQTFDLLSKFLTDLDLTQEMVYPIETRPSGDDRIREPEVPSKGPVTSFGHRIPKVGSYLRYILLFQNI